MYIGVNGVNLFYTKRGHGRPLILVHGNGEDHTIFDEAVGVLERHFTCYAIDSRGHGQSSPCRELHYKDMAQDMIAFMTELDLTDVAFYGYSDGGIVGLYAAQQCGRITDLITSGANLTPNGVKGWFKIMVTGMGLIKRDPLIELMKKEPDLTTAEISKIKARTLITAGSRDLIRESETKKIAESIPNAKLMILDGESHGSYIVHSTKIADILKSQLLSSGGR